MPDYIRRAVLSAGVAGALSGCSATAFVNATTPALGVSMIRALPYGADPRQQVDVYWAQAPERSGVAVVFFYGGSWSRGSREDYAFVGKALAARGITVVIADYRLSPQVRYPEFLKDAAAAVAWAVLNLKNVTGREHPSLYVMGHSAGAYNAAMLALDERWLAAVGLRPQSLKGWIGLAGPYDFLPIGDPEVRVAFNHPDVPDNSQPLYHARRQSIRAFIAAPARDRLVDPKRNSEALAARLRAVNTEVVFKRYEDTNHVTILGALSLPLRLIDPVLEDLVAFIR